MKSDYDVRLGNELEFAIKRSVDHRRRPHRAAFAVALGFVVVVLATLPVLLSRAVPDEVVAAYEQRVVPTASVPIEWGRVPFSRVLEGGQQLSLGQVAAWDGGMLAVGTDTRDGALVPVVLRSIQLDTWTIDQNGIPASGSLDGVAIGDGSAVVVGSDGSGQVGIWYRATPEIGDGQWQRASIERTAAQAGTTLHRAEAIGEGFAAFGASQSGERATAAIALSQDGSTWQILTDPDFAGAVAEATGGTAADGAFVVSGVWSGTRGESNAVVWRGFGDDWTRIPLDNDSVRAGATGVASRDSTLVAVGFDGNTGAIWRSTQGTTWNRVISQAFVPDTGSVRMYDVRATTAGFIVTGAHVDGTDFKRLTWMSQDGLTWRLLDLVDSSDLGGTVAFGLAAHDGVVVAVGAEVGDEKSIGAIWVSPSPTNFVLSLPATADVDSVPHINEVIPSRAAADTEVAVEVGSAGSGAVLVTVGDTVACNATGPSDSKRCTFTPGSLGIPLGTHEISVGPDSQNWMLEVVPAGTPILTIDAVYQPNTWPLVFAVFVKNRGADPVDLKGWWIADRNGDAYVVRDVTVVPPGGSLTISQAGNEGSPCPPDEGLSRHMCNYFGDAVIDHSNRVWSGSDLTLSDPSGTEVDVWSRPR